MTIVKIEEMDESADAHLETVYGLLRAYNRRANPDFWEALEREENQPENVCLFVFDNSGEVIGGLLGTTQFAWLKIEVMAVAETHRGCGIGRSLVQRAEEIARERGCRHAYVDTMDYQAPGFYQKTGYTVTGQLADWDSHGHQKYFLVKDL